MTLINPLPAWRFRVNAGGLTEITQNTVSVAFDFAKKEIDLIVRQTIRPSSIEQAYLFASTPVFDVEALTATDQPAFGIKPVGVSLVSHNFVLAYADHDSSAVHEYKLTYQGLVFGEPVLVGEDENQYDADPAFPNATTLDLGQFQVEEVELDDQQESRYTPDNPDTDGDGTPDKQDTFPNDPTRQ